MIGRWMIEHMNSHRLGIVKLLKYDTVYCTQDIPTYLLLVRCYFDNRLWYELMVQRQTVQHRSYCIFPSWWWSPTIPISTSSFSRSVVRSFNEKEISLLILESVHVHCTWFFRCLTENPPTSNTSRRKQINELPQYLQYNPASPQIPFRLINMNHTR